MSADRLPLRLPSRRLALSVALPLLGLAALRVALFDAYSVPTGSMEPCLHGEAEGGDRVLVLRAPGAARRAGRFDLVVFASPEGAACVKRLGGLPGESVQIVAGDLWIDGRLWKKSDAERARLLVPVFDSSLHEIDDFFVRDARHASLAEDGTLLVLPYHDETTPDAPFLQSRLLVMDGYLAPDGRPVRGRVPVRDLALSIEAVVRGAGGTLRVDLMEEGDQFEFRLRREGESAEATIVHRAGERAAERARAFVPSPAEGRPFALEVSNVDDRLRLRFDGSDLFPPVDYDGNTPYLVQEGLPVLRNGVRLGGEDLEIEIRRIVVLRDLHHTPPGRFGVERPVFLGPDEYFFLGDRSTESVDGREWGPIHGDAFLGLPVLVFWPLSRIRRL